MTDDTRVTLFSPEVREWAVRVVASEERTIGRQEAIASVCEKVGCTPDMLRRWLRQVDLAGGFRKGLFGPFEAPTPAPRRMITILGEPLESAAS